MKKLVLLISVASLLFACNDKKDNIPPKEILGEWKMEYYIYEGEKYLPEEGYYIIVFTGDWRVKQFPGFVEKGVPFTLNGKNLEWKANSNTGKSIDFKYNYSYKGDTLLLENLIENEPYMNGTSYYIKE